MWDTDFALELDQEELEGVPQPGDVVVEKYRVDRVLGVGGMGCVVAATHASLLKQILLASSAYTDFCAAAPGAC